MDPLSITAATIAIIGSISSTYNAIQHLRGLPKAFLGVGQNLPLVKETLELARSQLQGPSDESVKKAIEPVIHDCQEKAIALNKIFDELDKAMKQEKDANDWSALVNFYRKTVVYMGKSHKVETLMQELLNNLKWLAIHQLFKVTGQGLTVKLENAVNELSAVEPSLPDSDFDTKGTNITQTNSDNARGLVSTGGHQENTMGHKFHSAGNMSFVELVYHSNHSNPNDGNIKIMIVRWLEQISQPLPFEEVQHKMFQISKKTPNSGQWLLKSPNFIEWRDDWRDGGLRKLWCHGIPKTGKTVLAYEKDLISGPLNLQVLNSSHRSIIINHLQTFYSDYRNVACIYIYFDYRKHKVQSLTNLLSSLLLQLLLGRDIVSAEIQEIYEAWNIRHTYPSPDEYMEMLKSQIRTFSKVFIVIDALDECIDDINNKTLSSLLRAFRALPVKAHMLFTSRPSVNFAHLINANLEIDVTADPNEMKGYLRQSIENHSHLKSVVESGLKKNLSFLENALDIIVEKSQGMFLLVDLHIQFLENTHNLEGFTRGLAELSRTPEEVYRTALDRIRMQHPVYRDLAINVLKWIVFAERALTIDELTHAIAIQDAFAGSNPGDRPLPKADLTVGTERALTSACAGIVVVDKDKLVRLAHDTAEEYLRNKSSAIFQDNHSAIAEACLLCLTNIPPRQLNEAPSSQDTLGADCNDYPLFKYAAEYWGNHILHGVRGNVHKLAWEFLCDKQALNRALRAIDNSRFQQERNASGLHIAAYFGLVSSVQKAMKRNRGINFNPKTNREETPLHWAIIYRRRDFLELLVEQGVDLNVSNVDKRTALHMAIMGKDGADEALVNLLLSTETVDLNPQDTQGWTPLRWAAAYGQLNIVEMLLRAGAEVDARDKDGWTALRWAAHQGHKTIVKLLIRHEASIETSSGDQWTLLRWAAREGREDIIKLLVEMRVDLNATDADGLTPLRWAVNYDRAMTAWLLIQAHADVDEADRKGMTALHSVVERCSNGNTSLQILWLLLENQANINAETKLGWTPLHSAASGGSHSAVWLLLEKGANINAQTKLGLTPLHIAASRRRDSVVKLLLEKGANPKQGDDNERTALHWAVEEQEMRVAELLIKKAGDIVHAADQEKRTALHCAASIGNTHIVELLLDHGAHINVQDRNGQTPLHLGVSQQHEGVVTCLLWKGADWSILNKKKRTAIHLATDLENEAIIEALRSFRLATGTNDADDAENTSHREATKPKNRNAKFAARVEDE